MVRLAISVEGPTEERFVKMVAIFQDSCRIFSIKKLQRVSAIPGFGRDVASSIGTVKGQDKRSALLRALDTTNASGCRVGIR